MKWVKKGLIYGPTRRSTWADNSALQPSPWLMDLKTIRVFVGFRDKTGIGRVGFIDVSADNPSRVLKVSERPALDIGKPGAFDDNGVVPCAVVPRNNNLFLYYAGYQLGHHVRFLAFSGLAISRDKGNSFVRYSNVPIFERTNEEFLFRAIHSVIYENHKWRIWYGAGNHFIKGKKKTLPVYDIRYLESKDGLHFPDKGALCLRLKKEEYRIGRPFVVKRNGYYEMYFGYATQKIPYRLTMATSKNGLKWIRNDKALRFTYSENDFDSKMSCYPAVISAKNKTYLFYNGNDYGRMGVGYAELT